MKNLLIIIAIVAGLSACKKDGVNFRKSPIGNNIKQNLNTATLGPANPANPYDSVGYLHNLLLSEIQPCVASFSPLTNQEISGCIIPIASKEGLHESGTPFYLASLIVKDSENDFRNIIENSRYSGQAKALLNQIVQIVKTSAINSNGDYTTIKAAIMRYEQQISGNSALSNDDKAMILSVTSVARYSTYYWQFMLPQQGLTLKGIISFVGTAMTDAVSLAAYRSIGFAADSSEDAWWQMVYGIPGDM